VHIPYVAELQGVVLANLRQKEGAFERDVAVMERLYEEALRLQRGTVVESGRRRALHTRHPLTVRPERRSNG
jgi:hypothetical protein